MKRLKKAVTAIVFAIAISTTFQCANQKVATNQTTFELRTPFTVKPALFQEWYAGIEVGGTGIDVIVPITNVQEGVVLQDVYFRNLKGKLVKKQGKYLAVLNNPSKAYTFKKVEKPADYPFDLKDNECVLSYSQNGQTKFHKIVALNEVAGTYYENGHPSMYSDNGRDGVASLDEEKESN